MKINCVICLKEINPKKDNYFKVEKYKGETLIGTDFAHVICWKERQQPTQKLNELLSGVTNFAKEKGIIPEKTITI